MTTIKLPYILKNKEDLEYISKLQKQYSNILRWSFNRFKDNLTIKEIISLFKEKQLKNVELIDTHFLYNAISEAKILFSTSKNTDYFILVVKKILRKEH